MNKLIMYSSSESRKEVLKISKINHEIRFFNFKEDIDYSLKKCELVKNIAISKINQLKIKDDYNLVCDTLTFFKNKVLAKPKNKEEAYNNLITMSGESYQVITCMVLNIKNKIIIDTYINNIYLNKYLKSEINTYIDNNDYKQYSAGIAIQKDFCRFVKKIDGCYYSILGLTISKLYNILKENTFFKEIK